MRVTLKTVNDQLADLGTKAELAKGTGYFFFRGGEAEDWIDRTVRVPTIGSLTLEQWLDEYQRLKTLNAHMTQAGKQVSPGPAKTEKPRHEAATGGARTDETREESTRDSTHKEACALKIKLLAELDQAHKNLVAVEEQEVRAARDNRVSDLVNLYVAANKERSNFDRALVAIRDHSAVHGC